MRGMWAQCSRWLAGDKPNFVFLLIVLAATVVLLRSVLGLTGLGVEGMATLFSGLLAGLVVWWQIRLLVRQLEYTAVQELDKEWNSPEMLKRRAGAWIEDKEIPNPQNVEDVLEFLEKVSTLEKERYISIELIWDTFGWYIGRYYYYCKDEIQRLRTYWTGKEDRTLYCDLEHFYESLLGFEARKRNLSKAAVKEEYHNTRGKFIRAEGARE
ncbi:MAG TPA: hypothetical protein VNO32_64115 [Candidatus Acidoferrum sp.]|nr:hypothetical protein [Candidatus Acidoferrum sp.]